MTKCLYCGRKIEKPNEQEQKTSWHDRCVRSFFGTVRFPELEINEHTLQRLAEASTNQGFTVPGVQKKLSLHLEYGGRHLPRLTLVDYPSGYILKPQTKEYPRLPEAEHLVMQMADVAGICTVPHALIKAKGKEDRPTFAYITKRVDRIAGKDSNMLAMEDFCQIGGRLTEDKYKGSYEVCRNIIREHSMWPGLDMAELFLRLIFCFVTGNSDMHLKNFSLMEDAPGSRRYRLSPAYDLLPVNLLLPEDPDETALTLRGKRSRFRRSDFELFAESCNVDAKAAQQIIRSVCQKEKQFLSMIQESWLSEEMKRDFKELLEERVLRLQ